MADWRDGSGGAKDKGKSKSRATPPVSVPSSGDWRGAKNSPLQPERKSERSWTGTPNIARPENTGTKKLFLVGLIGLAALSTISAFLIWIYITGKKLPVLISIAGSENTSKYQDLEIGENPFGSALKEYFRKLPEDSMVVFGQDPSSNFLRDMRDAPEEPDSWRELLKMNRQFLDGGRIRGGGPNSKLSLFFVSCFVVRSPENPNDWLLVSDSQIPYSWDNASSSASKPFTIESLFGRVAEQTSDGSVAWIVLDVQQPPILNDLDSLHFPVKAFEDAYAKQAAAYPKKQLVVTLPCSHSGERNWIAPEFACSAFAHFFLEGIATGFNEQQSLLKQTLSNRLTINDFEKNLAATVSNWVGLRRHAQQTPKFLKPESMGNLELVEVSHANAKDVQATIIPSKDDLEKSRKVLEDRYSQLEKLWNASSKWSRGYLWDPLGFGEIESLLIQMENIAPYAVDNEWAIYFERANERITTFTSQSTFRRRVSIVETAQQSRVRPTTIPELGASDNGFRKLLAPFAASLGQVIDSSTISTGNEKNSDLQKFLLWYALVDLAQSKDQALQDRLFRGKALGSMLKRFASSGDSGNEWLEIQFLKILQSSIGWDDESLEPNPVQIKATCQLVSSFHQLQELSHSPFPEIAKLIAEDRARLDARWLQSFDYFLAHRWDKIEFDFQRELLQLQEKVNNLESSILLRDRLCQETIHNLSALIQLDRVEQFSQSIGNKNDQETPIAKSNAEQIAKTLGKLVDRVIVNSNSLPESAASDSARIDLDELQRLEDDLRKNLEGVNTSAQDQQGQHIRHIALRWPQLNAQKRKAFHADLADYWYSGQGTRPSTQSHELVSYTEVVFRSFMGEIDKSKRDLISDILQRPRSDELRSPLLSSDEALLTELERQYQRNLFARFLCGTFGQFVNSRRVNLSRLKADDFLLAPQTYWQIADAHYRSIHAKRLCEAAWGNGDIQGLPRDDFYFVKLVRQFEKSDSTLNLASVDQSEKEIRDSLRAAQDLLSQSRFEIIQLKNKQLELATDAFRNLQQNRIYPNLHQTDFAPVFGNSNRRAVALEYTDDQKSAPPIKTDATSGVLHLSFRGNFLAQAIPESKQPDGYEVAFENKTTDRASLSVSASYDSPVSVILLLDCSSSMKRNRIFAEAKDVVMRLMGRMEELVGQERRNIQLQLMTFAVGNSAQKFFDRNSWETLSEPASVFSKDATHNTYLFWTKQDLRRTGPEETLLSIRATRDLLDDLDDTVLASGSFTPLYHAIVHAARQLEASSPPDTRRVVIVISDGFDYPPDPDKAITTANAREALSKSQSELFIFQYENDESIREIAKGNSGESLDNLKARSVQELQDLMNLGRNRKLLYKNFEDMKTDLEALFPRWRVDFQKPRDGLSPLQEDSVFGKRLSVFLEKGSIGSAEVRGYEVGMDPAQNASLSPTVYFEGDEHLRLFQRGKRLEFIRFEEDLKENARDDGLREMEPRSNSSIATDHIVRSALIERSGKIELRSAIGLRNTNNERSVFVRRPKLLLAEISTREPLGSERTVILSDVNFRKGTHYPILEFPAVPWQTAGREWISERVDVDLWIAEQWPTGTIEFSWSQLESGSDGLPPRVRAKVEDTQATIWVDYDQEDERYFVVCRNAKASLREHQKGKDTLILQRDPAVPNPSIQLIPRKQLDEWSQNGDVEHFWENNVAYRR